MYSARTLRRFVSHSLGSRGWMQTTTVKSDSSRMRATARLFYAVSVFMFQYELQVNCERYSFPFSTGVAVGQHCRKSRKSGGVRSAWHEVLCFRFFCVWYKSTRQPTALRNRFCVLQDDSNASFCTASSRAPWQSWCHAWILFSISLSVWVSYSSSRRTLDKSYNKIVRLGKVCDEIQVLNAS